LSIIELVQFYNTNKVTNYAFLPQKELGLNYLAVVQFFLLDLYNKSATGQSVPNFSFLSKLLNRTENNSGMSMKAVFCAHVWFCDIFYL
jgi:hypothetical protein